MAPISTPPASVAIFASAATPSGNAADTDLHALLGNIIDAIWKDAAITSPKPDKSHIFVKPDINATQYRIVGGVAELDIPSSVMANPDLGGLIQTATKSPIVVDAPSVATTPQSTASVSTSLPITAQFGTGTIIINQATLDEYIKSDLGDAGYWPKPSQPANAHYDYDAIKAQVQVILANDKANFDIDVKNGVSIADAIGNGQNRAEHETGVQYQQGQRSLLSPATRILALVAYAVPQANKNLEDTWARITGDTSPLMLAPENLSSLPANINSKDMATALEATLAKMGVNWKLNIQQTSQGELGAGDVDSHGNTTIVISSRVIKAEIEAHKTPGKEWHDAEKVAAAYGLAKALLNTHRDLIEKTYASVLANPDVAARLEAQFPDKNDPARKAAEDQLLAFAATAGIMHSTYPKSPDPEATLAKHVEGRAAIYENFRLAAYGAAKLSTDSQDANAAETGNAFIGEAEKARAGHDAADKAKIDAAVLSEVRAAWGTEPINQGTVDAALKAAKSIPLISHAQTVPGPKISWVTPTSLEPGTRLAEGTTQDGRPFTITSGGGHGRG